MLSGDADVGCAPGVSPLYDVNLAMPQAHGPGRSEAGRSRLETCSLLTWMTVRRVGVARWMSSPRAILRRRVEQDGGARRDRTDDLKLAKLPLSQLSYGPFVPNISRPTR
jgi:hypothetical protein